MVASNRTTGKDAVKREIMTGPTLAEQLEASTQRCLGMDAPLAVRLRELAGDVRRLSPEFADTVDLMVARLADNGVGLSAPAPGEPIPPFMLPDQAGRLVTLAEFLERGPTVIAFHRGHWCPYCRLNADALTKLHPVLAEFGAQIVAITPELSRFAAEFVQDCGAQFPVLTDIDGGYALELGLLFWVGGEKREAMQMGGYDISRFQGNNSWMLPVPGTFVVRRDGIVSARHIDPDYRRRMDVDEIVAAVKALA
jgi:peroxiredoxin